MSVVIARVLCGIAVAVSFAALQAVSFDAAAAPSSTPPSLVMTAGDGQLGPLGEFFPQRLAVRVTDADGQPVAGVSVYFEPARCMFDGTLCLLASNYPFFAGYAAYEIGISDENGIAVAPDLAAGDVVLFTYASATIYADGPSSSVVATVYFRLWQVPTMSGVSITSGFSGAWYNPNQSGHGLIVEVLTQNRLVAYWFAFDSDGNQAWFGGDGTITGDQGVVYAYRGQGGQWIPDFDPAHYSRHAWGPLTFTFTDCNHGRVYYSYDNDSEPGPLYWGVSYLDLTRLTQPAGLNCP
jgi:hypothetical protein